MNIKVNNYLYNEPAQEIWNFVKDQLHRKYGEATYKSWIEQIRFVNLQNGILLLEAPTKFIREWVRSHYSEDIKSFWRSKDESILDLDISANNYLSNPIEQNNITKENVNNDNFRSDNEKNISNDYDDVFNNPLDKRFTFDNFVVGTPNELAYAASRSVAESSKAQNKANPLFLYGGVGLGKTHLMHAVAWHIKQNDPKRKVIYVSAEKFMYQFIKALRNKDVMSFKELFRSADVLMIDDVQFICGKDSTQEELFHTLNTVMDNNRQLIISADRSPSDLAKMEERIKSRLAWGLVVDVHSTDYELRYRILMLKSTQMNVHIPKEVIEFLAAKITSNVRELEGALNKVVAHSTLIGGTITLETTQHILKDLLRANEKIITIDDIQRKVAERFNIKISEMFSACRVRNIARSRQIAMYLAKFLTSRSLAEIGKKFGGKDHTTVMHAIRKIEELMKSDSEINEDIEILTKILQN